MEWKPIKSKKEDKRLKLRGRMATHEIARRRMAEEIARVQGRKKRNPHLEVLERAAQAWQRKKMEEFRRKREERRKTDTSIEIIPISIKEKEAKIQHQDLGIVDWLQQGLAQWAKKNQPENKKEGKRRPNSAGMGVILRRAVAKEKALALGRKLPNPRAIILEREAAQWRKKKEEKKKIIQREIKMLQKLIQFTSEDGFYGESKKGQEWSIGQVSCFVDKLPQNGWNLTVFALEKSRFMLYRGWGDLLGIYQAKLDDQLNIKDYIRITPQEIEEYLRKKSE